MAGFALLLAVASLSGCFSVLHAAQRAVDPEDMRGLDSAPTATPTTRPVSTVPPEAALVKIPADTIVAQGAIRSPGRAFYGRITIVSTVVGGYTLEISDFHAPQASELFAALASREVSSDSTCDRRPLTDADLPALGSTGPRASATFPITAGSGEFSRDDPTFLTNVLFIDPRKSTPGCLAAIAANARIIWNMPDMNPGFRTLDTGETEGARGEINSNFQQLISYTVAQGDVFAEIAARFSITTEDLEWLNPNRVPGQLAQLGETLNLARYLR